ncbi:SDR family NAD(P)-dependent oxidoreductase [Mycobacterium sp.]|uniref:SDR family NAD(P)-dependent oxidoreductase n=1 Tax=Mycobacterium sp. TaxID=1785 RepID=UPI000CA8146B|nr:SDR family NAD(P)-dependent oxidoreductase [Mycobacterium sp.]PJE11636.1 MAG: short-chain dehydrogenase [Mycobacterium sp.]
MTKREQYGPWAVITGASDGIGRAVAEHVAAQGLDVIIAARSDAKLQTLANDLERSHGVKTQVVVVDLGKSSGATTLLKATDGLEVGLAVLAAGFGTTGAFHDSDPTGDLEMIAVNVAAVAQLAQSFASRMVAQGHGGIVLFGSILGRQGVPGQANYAATKAYVQSLAEGMHRELKPRGVDVLSVAPGPVHSGFAARAGLTMRSAAAPAVVAKAIWSALGRRVTVVPGTQAKFLTASLALLPRRVRTIILGRVMASMRR